MTEPAGPEEPGRDRMNWLSDREYEIGNEPDAKRMNVAVSPETLEILRRTIDRDGVSLTEAVRRLVGVGDIVMTAVKEAHQSVLLANGDGTTSEMVIL